MHTCERKISFCKAEMSELYNTQKWSYEGKFRKQLRKSPVSS